jgi:hypothetical protein
MQAVEGHAKFEDGPSHLQTLRSARRASRNLIQIKRESQGTM